jgi:hypothetical protein
MSPRFAKVNSTMWRDPIVAEVRRNREQYAARFNHDIKALCRAARESQKNSGREIVSLAPKRVAKEARPDGQSPA